MNKLGKLNELVNKLNSTNSSTEKKDILSQYRNDADIKLLLWFTYNPLIQFYVTSANCKKQLNSTKRPTIDYLEHINNIFGLLNALKSRKITGHEACGTVNWFIGEFGYQDLIYKIIDRDLEIRMGESLINKAIPGCIPTFDVALATEYEPKLVDFNKDCVYASRKLDGVRCATLVDNSGKASSFSRQGIKFTTLGKVEAAIEKFCFENSLINVVFDGEICLIDNKGQEDFQNVMKQIRKKDHTIENPRYKIFDLINMDDFLNKKSKEVYYDRLDTLKSLDGWKNNSILNLVEQKLIKSDNDVTEMLAYGEANGWEGLILRKNTIYEGKRSKNMLKVKSFKDAEYTVLDVVIGPFQYIGPKGLNITENMLSSVVIEHKGNKVNVGSGFTIDERKEFTKNPNKIIGKIITVKYFNESKNQDGKYSLRFPTVKIIHGDKRIS